MEVLPQQLLYLGAALICAGIGSVYDLRERRIPNLLTGPAILIAIAAHAVVGGWHGLGDAALAGGIAGAIFLLFFLAGGMGAGDVKLMVAVGCFTGMPPLRLIVIWTALSGALFGVAVGLCNRRLGETVRNAGALLLHHARHGLKPHPELNLSNTRSLRLPFALPIAAGCLLTIWTLASGARP